ncbi:MAG: Nramp family divalent metal transporter [Chitinophagaceae bacterium]|nr:Nramp family divalent metal transporter [Chitinophagaceae bacterium]
MRNKWISHLGPGIITAALVFGPSKITIATKLGAEYGFQLLWVILIAIFFMVVFTSMSARIGIATNQSLLDTIKQKWGRKAGIAIGFGVFLVTASFQAGNSIGVGIAMAELTNMPRVPWIIFFNLVGIALLFFRSFYKVLEKAMLILICLMLFAFLTTLFLSKPDVTKVATGFVPEIPIGSLGLITAFIASSFSIVAAFYQAYLIQERKRLQPAGTQTKDKSFTGIFILGLMTAIVLICSAVVLQPKGIKVTSATDMSKALEPLFGNYASVLFLCGLFGASFSALIGNSTLGGTVLGDALGYGSKLSSKAVRLIIAIIMILGAAIAIIFGNLPIELIVFAQSITILIVPFIGIAMYVIANNTELMGSYVNSKMVKFFGAAGLLLVIALALESIRTMLF